MPSQINWTRAFIWYTRLAPFAGVIIGLIAACLYDLPEETAQRLYQQPKPQQGKEARLQAHSRQLTRSSDIAWSDRPDHGHRVLDPDYISWSNLFRNDDYEKGFFQDASALVAMVTVLFIIILGLMVAVNFLSVVVIPRIFPGYKDLDTFGQMAVTINFTYSIMLLLQIVPYTVCMVGILFGRSEAIDYPAINYTVFVFLVMHAIIYTYEGIARCIVKVNYLLLIHHAGFFIFFILDLVFQSNFVIKVGLILDYFVVWEAGLFLTNVFYRLKVNYTLMKWTMIIGTTVHGVTHLLQAALLTAFFAGMGKRLDKYEIGRGVFALYILLSYALMVYQFYLEKIFYEMWLKIAVRHAKDKQAQREDVEMATAARCSSENEVEGEKQLLLGMSTSSTVHVVAGVQPPSPNAFRARGKGQNRDGLSADDWAATED